MAEVIVINTRTRTELEVLAPVILNAGRLGMKPVFVRRDESPKVAEKTLLSDIAHLRMRMPPYDVVGLTTQSITSALGARGYRIGMYLGSDVNTIGKAPSKTKPEVMETVKYRYARICSGCESVLAEVTRMVTPKKAEQQEQANKGELYEVEKSENSLTIIEKDRCRLC